MKEVEDTGLPPCLIASRWPVMSGKVQTWMFKRSRQGLQCVWREASSPRCNNPLPLCRSSYCARAYNRPADMAELHACFCCYASLYGSAILALNKP